MINRRYLGILLAVLTSMTIAAGQTPQSQPAQQVFPTTQAAVDTLLDACRDNDSAALVRMMGQRFEEQIKRVDDDDERRYRKAFYEMAQAHLTTEQPEKDRLILLVGRDLWPLPIPLVKESAGWRFDTEAGLEELQARRVGENELAVIGVCGEYVRMQAQYAAVDRDSDEVREYAQQLVSASGKRDGLYWEWDTAADERPSPLEALLPDSFGEVKDHKPGAPHMGYYYRILTRQGTNPPGGKYDYIINGNMIAGFALVAWPADYRVSGVMTFVISHQGKLLEKDLGLDTDKLVRAMTEYNPDKTWTVVEP